VSCLQDGRNWARIEAEHHTHALFDVGPAGAWDSTFIGHPQVVSAGPRDMRMYYHSFDVAAGKFKVGMATSKDGFNWKKEGVVFEGGSSQADFDAGGAAACHVVSGQREAKERGGQCCFAAEGTERTAAAVPAVLPSESRRAWSNLRSY
jgi:hypothetical protein